MVFVQIECPHCKSTDVNKYGLSAVEKQRYLCKSCKRTFHWKYTYKGCEPSTRSQVYFKAVNGSGTRAIARELKISTNTVTSILLSFEESIWNVNYDYLNNLAGENIEIDIISGTEAEMDEMWSFVHDKSQQYWLLWAIDDKTGEPLAFCFGTREHKNLRDLNKLLEGFNITTVYVDGNPAYQKLSENCNIVIGKRNTQKIKRKHLSLRTWCSRLVRKGIRFSKSHKLHAIVVSLVINHWFFNRILA